MKDMQNGSKHTPGPWTAECLNADTDCWQVPEPLVSCGSDGDYLNEANARLMAAAPELLEMLREIVQRVEIRQERRDRIEALIAKAEGRSDG